MFYRQVKLKKDCWESTCWIPERFAVVGKLLGIKSSGVWVEGWIVSEIYSRLDEKTVLSNQDQYRHHREVTDI